MPQLVPYCEQPVEIVARQQLVALIEFGDAGERSRHAIVSSASQAGADRLLHRHQCGCNREVLLVVQVLTVEDYSTAYLSMPD